MAFSESIKKRVRQRAKLRCCICREMGVEIHHIIPLFSGGSDDEDNAAPLCPNHHEMLGSNPDRRNFIRDARDLWYQECEDHSQILNELKATRELVETLSARNRVDELRHSKVVLKSEIDNIRYSFSRQEYVHPLILRELLGWISDAYETITGVDVAAANRSNRFFGDFEVTTHSAKRCVRWKGSKQSFLSDPMERKSSFSYSHIATSPTGIEMVECYDCGGGSGVFGRVAFFSWERDSDFGEYIQGANAPRERLLLKLLGSISLGDRYGGEITYDNGILMIGPDRGWFNRGEAGAKRFRVS